MRLIKLSPVYKAAYYDYMREFYEEGERIVPGAAGSTEADFAAYLRALAMKSDSRHCPWSWIPSDLWFLEEGGRLLGAIDFRRALNDRLLQFAGHIGYGVRPSERGKGYATAMLRMVLDILRDRGVGRVLLTCREDHAASARVIEKCGGSLQDIREGEGELYRRYWISLAGGGSAVFDGKDLLDDPALQQLAALSMYMPAPEKVARRVHAWQADPGVRVFALDTGGEWKSILVIADRGEGAYEILSVATRPSARNRGYAGRLVKHAQQVLPMRSLIAETDDDAVDFYRQIGFDVTSLGETYAETERYLCRYPRDSVIVGV